MNLKKVFIAAVAVAVAVAVVVVLMAGSYILQINKQIEIYLFVSSNTYLPGIFKKEIDRNS